MTERERYQKRKAYYVKYAAKNREKRLAASRRWRLRCKQPKKEIAITGDTLRERFLAYRKQKNKP